MTPGFDLTNFGSAPAPVTPKPFRPVVSHVEEEQDPILTEPTSSDTKEVNGHTLRKSSGKPVSTESGLLKELNSDHPQINPLPDEVVDRNIKAGIL